MLLHYCLLFNCRYLLSGSANVELFVSGGFIWEVSGHCLEALYSQHTHKYLYIHILMLLDQSVYVKILKCIFCGKSKSIVSINVYGYNTWSVILCNLTGYSTIYKLCHLDMHTLTCVVNYNDKANHITYNKQASSVGTIFIRIETRVFISYKQFQHLY